MEDWKQQGSDSWKAVRRTKVTATDASIIMGLNPWSTQYKLWSRKLGLIPEEPENEVMRRGKEMEAEALEIFNNTVVHKHFPDVVFHPQNPWMMASLDGYNPHIKTVVEIKCGKNSFQRAVNHEIPDYYYSQMQFQLACLGADMAYYFCFDGISHVVLHVFRDDDFIAKMIPKCHEFYQCLLSLTPPELTEKDYLEVEDTSMLLKLTKLREIKLRIKDLEFLEKMIENEIKEYATASECNLKGSGLRVSKIIRKGNIDYLTIPELDGIDLEQYRKPFSEYWQIRIGD